MDRYSRHIVLSEIGEKGQEKLLKAKVLVVGAGGLGCPVLQYLAAAGIGTIGIIDFDVVETSNLQRQVLFGASSLGQNKAEATKSRLMDLNDSITVNAYPEKLTYQNTLDLFNQYHIIVDGTDNFETRYLINDACVLTNKPLVFGAIYKFQGQVSVFNYNNGPTYRCAFPNKPKRDAVPNCSEIGVLGVLPGIIGSIQANEVLKMILGIGKVLSGQLLCYDALTNQTSVFNIVKSEKEIQNIILNKNNFQNQKMDESCDVEDIVISIKEFLKKENLQLIDIREPQERPRIKGFDITKIPLDELKQNLDLLNNGKEKAFFCQYGVRSINAVSILNQNNIYNCYSIKEGASEINRYLKEIYKPVKNE